MSPEAVSSHVEITTSYYRQHPPRPAPPRLQEMYDKLYGELIHSSTDSSSRYDGDPAFGVMHLTLTLGSFSLTTLSDDNPIDMLDFIANIGGFWGECVHSSSPLKPRCS